MLTGMLVQRESLLELIGQAKTRKIPVAVGGPYPTSLPEEILEAGCDYLIKGEGENSIQEFLAALNAGESKGIFENAEKPELDSSPVPRFDLLKLDDYDALSLQTSRGCPFACEFCDIISLFGRRPRHKSTAQVLAEFEAIYKLGFKGTIFVADDNFIGNRPRAVELLQALAVWQAERGEPFGLITQASVNLGQDKSIIDLMTAANFSFIFVGIESPDEDVLTMTHKHQNVSNPLLESLRAINDNGLSIIGSFILGFDQERKGCGKRIEAFAEAADIPLVMVNVLRALPNTQLWTRLKSEGRLQEAINDPRWDELTNFTPTRPLEDILSDQTKALDRLYSPEKFLERALRATLGMRPTRGATSGVKSKVVDQVPQTNNLNTLGIFLSLVWRQGIISRARIQFWTQLVTVMRKNPSRLHRYMTLCALGENMFLFKRQVRKRAGELLHDLQLIENI